MEHENVVDSSRSWIVAISAFVAHLITHGIVYSFGILFLTLQENFKGTKAELSWIPSLSTGCLYLIGPVASILINRYGCRTVTIFGSILGFTGYLTSIFVRQLFVLYFTLGIIAGCGFGMVFLPAILIVTKYFNKYRSLACGIALSGAGGGAFIFSPLIEFLLDTYAWKGTLLLLSAIILNCIPCAMKFRSPPVRTCAKKFKDSTFDVPAEYDDENLSFLVSENGHCTENIENKKNCELNVNTLENKTADDRSQRKQHAVCSQVTIEIVKNDNLRGKTVELVDFSKDHYCPNDKKDERETSHDTALKRYRILFKSTEVTVFFLSQFLFFAGFYIPFIYIPDKATNDGVNETSASWIASTIGISSIAGRLILGYLADRPFVNRLTMFKIALITAGISTSLLPLSKTVWMLQMYAVIYGISSGITLSLTSVVLADIVGIRLLADAMGLNNLFSAFGSISGPPITGFLFDVTQTYTASFLTAGFGMTTSGILLVFVSYCLKQR